MTAGLVLFAAAVVLLVAFVAAVVVADRRLHAVDPAATSGWHGLPAVLGVAAVVCAVASLGSLTVEVARGWLS